MPHILGDIIIGVPGFLSKCKEYPSRAGVVQYTTTWYLGCNIPEVAKMAEQGPWLACQLQLWTYTLIANHDTLPQFQFDLNSLPNMSPALQVLFLAVLVTQLFETMICSP